jgi:membrane protease YdiL (CAAX protease family)
MTLLVSLLPDILLNEFAGGAPAWLFWAKIGLLGGGLLISFLWSRLRALGLYFAVILSVYGLSWGVDLAYHSLNFAAWFAKAPSFAQELFSVQVPRAITGGLLVLLMLALTGRFERFFFIPGKLDAPAAPIPLILTRPPSWRCLGPAIAAALPLGIGLFVFIFGQSPSREALQNVPPLLPFVLIFAASNAFGEEMLYRAPWLAALEKPLGPTQALLITAVYFGLAHFYGVPYGIPGVLMAFIPGWLMGKAMLETRGFFWAWLIHFAMDAVIFFFMALGAVTPGG